MGRPEWCVDHSSAAGNQTYWKTVQSGIDNYVLECSSGEKGSNRVNKGNEAFQRQSPRHANEVLFGDPFHEDP